MHLCCPPARVPTDNRWLCACGGGWLFVVRSRGAGWERAAGVQLGRCERAEALAGRYRAALEQIAVVGCDGDWGLVGRQTCTQRKSAEPCPSCIACAALEEK